MIASVGAITREEVDRIVGFREPDPTTILGPKLQRGADGRGEVLSIRAFLPRAVQAWVTIDNEGSSGGGRGTTTMTVPMRPVRGTRFYEARIGQAPGGVPRYVISFRDESGYEEVREDPYSFGPFITDYDLYLMSEGTHRRSFEKMGAHPLSREGVEGVQFAVWAPNARSVSVVGDFNHWTPGAHPMSSRGGSGIWELFVPRLRPSELYKFAIKPNLDENDNRVLLKTDPYAFRAQLRPDTAAIVTDLESYQWRDGSWMAARVKESPVDKPVSIYEVHLSSWKRRTNGGEGQQSSSSSSSSRMMTYAELADDLIPYVKRLGFTHVELMPIMEHPLDDSWGYQVVNYFAPTSRFGGPTDFMHFVDRCHENGIGVILDWVPGHFPKDDYGLALFDGTHLYEHADPRKGLHPEWGTYIFNYSRNEVRTFLISNAIFWLEKYHVDGLRLDAVASMLYLDYARGPGEWVPNARGGRENLEAIAFLKELNQTIHSMQQGVMIIAEESTAWQGVTKPVEESGLGFDLKWNMGWMHDTLDYYSKDPVHRKYHQNALTFSLWYAWSERFVLVLSHDEVVYGKRSMLSKMPGDEWQKFANLRLCYGYMFTHPGKKLLFMGDEFGQWDEWDFRRSLDWHLANQPMHGKLTLLLHDLNRLYRERRELNELDFSSEGFQWVDFLDAQNSVITYLRRSRDGRQLLVAANMTPVPRHGYRIGVPRDGFYREILNSDAAEYGGSGMGNLGGVSSTHVPWNNLPFSVLVTLPPLAIIIFSPESA